MLGARAAAVDRRGRRALGAAVARHARRPLVVVDARRGLSVPCFEKHTG
jgi:hypothetical protein